MERLGGAGFDDVSFTFPRARYSGITGLLPSGRNELALSLAGVEPRGGGSVQLAGRRADLSSPASAIEAGIGYVPEDRCLKGFPWEIHPREYRHGGPRPTCGGLRPARQPPGEGFGTENGRRSAGGDPDIDNPVMSLSGGNQQRVLIGRWLTIEPSLLILHGPTVRLDVGSKDTIFRIIQRLAGDGMSVIIISDDLPELLQNCDRVMVMRKGGSPISFRPKGLRKTQSTSR
ncbi:ATP-binding cassette domain-containing protein (plasmid) [Sinorhizobium meliloti]|nr:ATP-binding cassette domain-containing protein [Sinorhizobium meliloti]